MAKIELSPSQSQAVNETGHNILVMASAGSGKTFVLIKRLMKRILADRISIDQIIAMTFTDAASIEMRNRLSKALKEAIVEAQKSGNQEEVNYLNLQLAKLVDAKISTIHSFCLDITKQYYYLLGISKNTCSNLIDDATAVEVKHNMLQNLFNELLRTNEETFSELAKQVGCHAFSFDELENVINSLANHANEKADPVAWLKTLYRNETINSLEHINQKALNSMVDAIQLDLAIFIEIYEQIAMLDQYCLVDSIKASIKELKELQTIDDYATLIDALTGHLQLPKKLRGVDVPGFAELIEQGESIGKGLAKKLIPVPIVLDLERRIAPLNNLLVDITIRLIEEYQVYKQTHEYIDFNDYEHYAYQILTKNNGAIAKLYQNQYQEILIDEFQDTNDIQYQMASLISKDNLFLVGDVKQSIYRFRGARPDIMVALAERDDFSLIHLQDNYRSKHNIVNFNNDLFEHLMNVNGHAFSDKDRQKAEQDWQKADNLPIIFRTYQNEECKDPAHDKTILLVEWIIELINKDHLKFKDICVLVRTNNEMTLIKKIFDDYHIPCFCKDNDGYFRSYIIEVLTSYLQLLINPHDEMALVSVLSSCLYAYSDDDLVRLQKEHYKSLYDSSFAFDYRNLKALLNENDLIGLINYFINIANVYNEILDLNERSNIDLLITKLQTYHISSAEELVKFILEAADTQKDKAYSISEEDDVVRISTIHGSKGLQYNTVILYSKNSNRDTAKNGVVNFSDDYGLGFHISRSVYGDRYVSLSYLANKNRDKIEELNENLRVLYVALTRAEKRLYFVDANSQTDNYQLSLAFFLKNRTFTPLILAAAKTFNDESFIVQKVEKFENYQGFSPLTTPKQPMVYYQLPVASLQSATPSKLSHKDIQLELTENLGLDVGTRMHRVMELLDFSDVSSASILKLDENLTPAQVNKILAVFKDEVFLDAIQYDYHREYPFYYVKDQQNIHGIIDFVSFAQDHIILIDYKTDNLETEEEFKERYHAQLEAYEQVLKDSFHLPVATYIYSFHLSKSIAIS